MTEKPDTDTLRSRIVYWQNEAARLQRFEARATNPKARAAFRGQANRARRAAEKAQAELAATTNT
jgi:hypothetical protein